MANRHRGETNRPCRNAWLHDFVTEHFTDDVIDPTPSGQPATELLGEDDPGVLIHDGWSVYDGFRQARHQQCLAQPMVDYWGRRNCRSATRDRSDVQNKHASRAHLMRRCHELLEVAVGGAVRFPRAVRDLFRKSLSARDRFAPGELTSHGLRVLAGRFTESMRRVVTPVKSHTANERLAKHLENHLGDLLTFLRGA